MKRLSLFVGMIALAASCGGGGGGDDNLPTTCDNAEFEATFVVDGLSIPDQNVGFDLDGENTRCESGCINDGDGGVDNRLGAVLDGIADSLGEDFNANEELDVQIQEGGLLILFRLVNICNFSADGDVDLLGYVGMDADDPEDPADNFSGTEAFDVNFRSLNDPGTDVNDPMISFPAGRISRGQFTAGPSVFNLDIPIQDSVLGLSIRETQVRFNFQPQPADDGSGDYVNGRIVEGLLGGFVLVEDLADALQEFADELGDIDPVTVMNIVVNQADIDFVPEGPTSDTCVEDEDCPVSWRECVDGHCYELPDHADAISLAIQFSGTSGVFTGTLRTCGDDHIQTTADGFPMDEVCDGDDLGGEDCTTRGHTGGTLACQDDCTGFDESACTD